MKGHLQIYPINKMNYHVHLLGKSFATLLKTKLRVCNIKLKGIKSYSSRIINITFSKTCM